MRLTDAQRRLIRDEVRRHFGDGARALLFGSRVDDAARGGDIDLFIETHAGAEEALRSELALYAALQRKLGERHIDIVVQRAGAPLRAIDLEARRTGVPL